MSRVSDWAKMPTFWVRSTALNRFMPREIFLGCVPGPVNKKLLNECIAALKLYLVLCCRANYETGLAQVTYDELIRLSKMSRALVARALSRLEVEQLIERKGGPISRGSSIELVGWLTHGSYAKIPKRWLYDGSRGGSILKLGEFNFSRDSLNALKIYIALLSFTDRHRGGLASISYKSLAAYTGVGQHLVGDAITFLYEKELISFRQAEFKNDDPRDRTNRYLIRGLGLKWVALEEEAATGRAVRKSGASKQDVQAALNFVKSGA